jgi:DNA-directed RNA polymerase specialized sigma subunit
MQLNTTIEQLLNEWGKWSSNGTGQSLCTPKEGDYADILDDTALIIDRAVGALGMWDSNSKLIIELRYRHNYSYPMLAKSLNVGETKAHKIHDNALAWLEGHLMGRGYLLSQHAA